MIHSSRRQLGKKQADKKIKTLNGASTVVTKNPTRMKNTKKRYEETGGEVPKGYDVDHMIDLQLGGKDLPSNMKPLDSSVNRSLGIQIHQSIKDLPEGTTILKFKIVDP